MLNLARGRDLLPVSGADRTMLDHGVRGWEEDALPPITPADEVGRRSVVAVHLYDLAEPVLVALAAALDDKFISRFRAHVVHLLVSPFVPGRDRLALTMSALDSMGLRLRSALMAFVPHGQVVSHSNLTPVMPTEGARLAGACSEQAETRILADVVWAGHLAARCGTFGPGGGSPEMSPYRSEQPCVMGGPMKHRDTARSVLFPPLDSCPGCRATGLQAQPAGDQTIFSCPACRSYWHVDLGWIHRVEPAKIPSRLRLTV